MPLTTLFLAPTLFAAVLGCSGDSAKSVSPQAHRLEVEKWSRQRLERLKKEDGWLTLVGLAWLPEGLSTFGPHPSNDIVVPIESSLLSLGRFERTGEVVLLHALAGAALETDGATVRSIELRSDEGGDPTVVRSGSVSFHLITRGERIGVRMRDSENQTRRDFVSIERYPTQIEWRFDARFEPAAEGTTMPVPNIIGEVFEEVSPGSVVFRHQASTHRLRTLEGSSGNLFLVFGDATNGKETYGSGRFLYTSPPDDDGNVVVDFNRSYNPPCVFTPWATCPLPPRGNDLPFAVRAGELSYALEAAH